MDERQDTRVKTLALIAALLPLAAGASDPWTRTDTALQLSFTAVAVVDWMQTLYLAQHATTLRPGYEVLESNPILGPHPSRARINTLVPAAIVTHALVAYVLPRPYRTVWQGIWIGVELDAVRTNYRLGASLTVPWD